MTFQVSTLCDECANKIFVCPQYNIEEKLLTIVMKEGLMYGTQMSIKPHAFFVAC